MSTIPHTTGRLAQYTFYITYITASTQVYPLNFLSSSLVDEREKDNIFYRRKFNGALTFTGDDFDYLYAIELVAPCSQLYFEVFREGESYWDGYFSTTDGNFDLDKCLFTVTPKNNDDYAYILDRADLQYNILNISPAVTTRAFTSATAYIDYTRNRWLTDVIEYLGADAVNGVMPGATVSSDFFTEATNPVTLNDNGLLYLTIAQKSDIIRPSSSDPSVTAMLSWNELMAILWAMFQIRWDYDSDTDTINVEHISWWPESDGLDLRTQELAEASNRYSYLKEKMPKYEKFAFMEADNLNFVGVPIWYDSSCVDPDPDSNVIEYQIPVTTDLQYIIDAEEAISDEGFVILCNFTYSGNYYVEENIGALDDTIILNARLSWANLHNAYFRHERVLIEGYLNNTEETFWTARKTKQQPISAIVCPEDLYDPADSITTELGETYFGGAKGQVQRSELLPTGQINFALLYGPDANENTGVDDNYFCVIGYISFPGKADYLVRLRFNKPAPGNYNIRIRENIYDDVGGLNCTGAYDTFTIVAGTIGLNCAGADPLCHTIDTDWCGQLEIEYTGAEIDDFECVADADSCDTAVTYDIL